MHGCESRWIKSVRVRELDRGAVIRDGEVQVFDLVHPKAKRAYAWSHENEGSDRRFHAVLGISPVHSAADAVKAVLRDEGCERGRAMRKGGIA